MARMKWWFNVKPQPPKPEPRFYINWDEVKSFEDLKTLLMSLPGARHRIDEFTAEELMHVNPALVERVDD